MLILPGLDLLLLSLRNANLRRLRGYLREHFGIHPTRMAIRVPKYYICPTIVSGGLPEIATEVALAQRSNCQRRGLPMSLPKSFQSFAEFEREIVRASYRLNVSFEDMVEDTSFEEEIEIEADDDPFSAMRDF